jgi:FSR family fosmidomycin resistance protein-like MFS transporter
MRRHEVRLKPDTTVDVRDTATVDRGAPRTAYAVLAAVSLSHLLNDTLQSLLPAIYPVLKTSFDLSFAQVGMMTLALMLTASVLQPVVGLITDRRPAPLALAAGMTFTLIGLLLLSTAWSFPLLLLAAALVGVGSAVFHPESSRVARMASGGRHGLAQSVFQVGGNAGSAIGPLVAAFLIAPYGQGSIIWCALLALAGIVLAFRIGLWQRAQQALVPRARRAPKHEADAGALPQRRVAPAIAILAALIFSKYFYLASLSSYFTFYLMTKFGLSVQAAQLHLFAFLAAVAVGTILGGPIGDRVGRKPVIWSSILGVLPFSLLLPHADLFWTAVLAMIIGLILSSAFSAIVVYAQELVPGRVGLISGVFFGFAFGMGGIGAAVLGRLADRIGIEGVYGLCAFLPAIGLLAAFLPDIEGDRSRP